jgi:hypothetical protein
LGALALTFLQRGDGGGLRLAGTEPVAANTEAVWMPALTAALQKDPAPAKVAMENGGSIAVARWFDTEAGLHCAEFTITESGAVRGGIACRKPDGGWDVIAQDR